MRVKPELAFVANYSLSEPRYHRQVSTNIAKIREAKGISQVQLAERLGIHVTNLNRIERGKASPSTKRLEQIADELGVDVSDLFAGVPAANVRAVRIKGHVQAGAWSETWEMPFDDQYEVVIPADESLARFKLHGAEVRGPSMNRRYTEGTVLIYADIIETGETVEVGRRYIVERERADGMREATVKTLWRDNDGQFWLLPESDDPRFQEPIPLEGGENDTIRIVGRVRYVVGRE